MTRSECARRCASELFQQHFGYAVPGKDIADWVEEAMIAFANAELERAAYRMDDAIDTHLEGWEVRDKCTDICRNMEKE